MPKLILNFDSTALGSSGCILDFIRTLVGEPSDPSAGAYREKCMNVELVYGIAVHKFLDMMYKTYGNYFTAGKAAKKIFAEIPFIPNQKKPYMSDEKHLMTTCYQVWSEYVTNDGTFDVLSIKQECWECEGSGTIEADLIKHPESGIESSTGFYNCPRCKGTKTIEGPATEVTFKIPYYEDDYILVNLCGTIDRIGKFKGGCFAIPDWKTTGSWDNDGYFEQYELSRQLRFYRLACRIMAERHPESVIGQIGGSFMGCFIEGIFLKANANETVVKRSPVYQFSDIELNAFQRTLDDKIQEVSQAVRTNYFPKQGILTGACEKKFSKCRYWHVCKSNEAVANVLLGREFIRKPYDPLNFNT